MVNQRKEYMKEYAKTHKKKLKEYRQTHREQINKSQRKWYYNNKNQKLEWCKQYRETHKEQKRKRMKKYNQTHKEQREKYNQTHKIQKREYNKKYYLEHREQIIGNSKSYYQKNNKKCSKQHKDYYWHHRKYRLEYMKTYLQSHRERWKKFNNKRHRKLGYNLIWKPSVITEPMDDHHINLNDVVRIPRRIHKSIWHNVWSDIGMKEINKLAFAYIDSQKHEILNNRLINFEDGLTT